MIPYISWFTRVLVASLLLTLVLRPKASRAQDAPSVSLRDPPTIEIKATAPDQQTSPPEPASATIPDSSGRGFGPAGNLFSPIVGQALPRMDYKNTWFPDERVSGQPTLLGFIEQDISVATPLWQNGANEWSLNASLRSDLFHTNAVLPSTGQPFPEDLWSIRLGTSYRHLFDNGWIAGASLSIGSASDQPFHSVNELTGGVNLFLRIPQGERNAWLFTLSYSPTAELSIPVPGVAYFWQPSDCLRVTVGLPFQLMWRPTEDMTFDVSYMLLRTVHARATYRLCRYASVYTGYDWNNESWYLVDRPDVHDRFFYFEQRVSVGVHGRLCGWATYDVSGGFSFDRSFFEGKNSSGQNFNRVDVNDAPILSLRFGVHF